MPAENTSNEHPMGPSASRVLPKIESRIRYYEMVHSGAQFKARLRHQPQRRVVQVRLLSIV